MPSLIERITPETWTKGGARVGGKICLAHHVGELYRWEWETSGRTSADQAMAALKRLDEAVLALYPERVTGTRPRPTAQFNDHHDTTLDDIHRVVKVAGL